uniref:Dedicator of cytokinesis 4 n=1 Tax=Myotis myotis TaxID=51298 RepID=A0A7J7V2K2_MYOMY|nr:dedicator of cytokinesis 4 [Myotis myotis]
MERLLDYRDCMRVGEVDGKKIGCTVSLLNFYKTELNKEEMYIRYIHKLYDLHLKAQNFTEAAYTLLLYDELLEWSDRPLREFLSYPTQTEWQRKEHLHLAIIQNFDRGKCWENGIVLCRKIAEQYESYYDYRNLSKMRVRQGAGRVLSTRGVLCCELPHLTLCLAPRHASGEDRTGFPRLPSSRAEKPLIALWRFEEDTTVSPGRGQRSTAFLISGPHQKVYFCRSDQKQQCDFDSFTPDGCCCVDCCHFRIGQSEGKRSVALTTEAGVAGLAVLAALGWKIADLG